MTEESNRQNVCVKQRLRQYPAKNDYNEDLFIVELEKTTVTILFTAMWFTFSVFTMWALTLPRLEIKSRRR